MSVCVLTENEARNYSGMISKVAISIVREIMILTRLQVQQLVHSTVRTRQPTGDASASYSTTINNCLLAETEV